MSDSVAPVSLEWASPVQEAIFQYGPYPLCASGGFGAGKTYALCHKALWLSDAFPRNRGVIFRRVAKELRQTTMATFFKICPPDFYTLGGRRNDQEGVLRLNNQSEILFMQLEDPNVQGILKGLEINWFLGDQAEEDPEHMEDVFDLLLGRLGRWDLAEVPSELLDYEERRTGRRWAYRHPTSGKPIPPPYAMLAVNPDSELHWVYRRFHPESADYAERYRRLGYRMFQMPSLDNRCLTDISREQLLAHDEAFIRRYVRGEWGFPEGAIHTIHPTSVVDGSPELLSYFREHCLLYRTFDYGDSAPTACAWWAVDRNENVFCFREYYQANALISTHRANIAALSKQERYEQSLADPSIFHQQPMKQGGRWSVADEYADVQAQARETAIFWHPAVNNELGTRNRINEYLRFDEERIHPVTRERGAARLFFVKGTDSYPNGVQHILRETRAQRRVKVGTDLGKPIFSDERDPGITDHGYDLLRYAVAARPSVPTTKIRPGSGSTFLGAQRLAKKYRRAMSIR